MVNDAKPGGAHEADVYVLDLVWMAQFVDRGYIRPLDQSKLPGEGLDDFIPKVLDTCKRNEKLWALPFNTDAGLIFYRSDNSGSGKPKSWDDYFGKSAKAAIANARDSKPGLEVANAAQLADEEVLTITALEAIWAAGGEVVSKNGQVLLNPDGTSVHFDQADLTGIGKLATASHDSDILLKDEARRTTEQEAITQFAAILGSAPASTAPARSPTAGRSPPRGPSRCQCPGRRGHAERNRR